MRLFSSSSPTTATPSAAAPTAFVTSESSHGSDCRLVNLSTVTEAELRAVVVAGWGFPKYRAKQIWHWIRTKGVTDASEMRNLPRPLQQMLLRYSRPAALELVLEQTSKDGTIKRAYRLPAAAPLSSPTLLPPVIIESVLMPYDDGRYTACISSQAGCAQGCVFCATGQMGFVRQLTADEIFEQVARFAAELQRSPPPGMRGRTGGSGRDVDDEDDNDSCDSGAGREKKVHGRERRLSNVVFMGMGEPLANYRNVMEAIHRINTELGIGQRKITVSTVGLVPGIQKLMREHPNVRLAVSLHSASDAERSALLPANRRNGGLAALMQALQEYIATTGKRITLEWALIAGRNDDTATARQLGQLITRHRLRRDMVHVNVIPLNPTGDYGGRPRRAP
jgi:23S rRNA (adenine2503-C2)-methyltransferase